MKVVLEYLNEFVGLISTIRLSDVLDILLVTALLYQIFSMVRKTNSARILKAVVLILMLAWFTELAELNTLHFLMSKVLELGLIALVILFQPELRRSIERLGSTSIRVLLSPKERSREINDVIAQTVSACEAMSREKVGALMVFERISRLDEYFKTGTIVDGRASEQLIRNIFFPKAALHDGAMIIRDGRVTAAGCVLPLSENVNLSADLGTRHRAGVGISEITDALVVIVSEETGTISVAAGGMLKRHLAPQTLEKLLLKELAPAEDAERERGIRQRLGKLFRKKEDGHEK